MGSKSREVIWGGAVMGANMLAKTAREEAEKAARAADRAEANAWSIRMEGYGGPAQPSPNKTRASLPLNAIRRPRDC